MRSDSSILVCIAALALTMLCAPARSATFKVDDSASETLQVNTTARWVSLSPGRGANNDVEVQTRVQVRLNVQPWLNRQGKIYMVGLGATATPFAMEWSSAGILLANRMQQGQRALVYNGKISNAQLSDVLQVTLRTDGRYVTSPTALRFGFEIDVE